MRKLTICLILLVLFCPAHLMAAPEISGVNLSTGTITGTSFGTKSTAAPLKFDNFEDGTVGQDPVETTEFWTGQVGKSDSNAVYSTTVQRTLNSPQVIDFTDSSSTTSSWFAHTFTEFETSGKFVASWWYYINWVSGAPGSNAQIKLFQLQPDDAHSSSPMLGADWFANPANDGPPLTYTEMFYGNGCATTAGGCSYSATKTYSEQRPQEGSWYRVLIQYEKSSGSGAADGSVTWWEQGVNGWRKYVASNVETTGGADGDTGVQRVKFGYLAVNTETTHEIHTYWDDMYFDNSWARVEIGDASTYESCTHLEMQIPSAWADGSITFTLNKGSFASDADVYFYVVDSNGVVNTSGFPMNLGSDVTPPTTTITTGSPIASSTGSATIEGTATDDTAVTGVKCRIGAEPDANNGTACTGTTSWSCAVSGLASGSNTVYCEAYDAAGNYDSGNTITANYTPPTANVTGVTFTGVNWQ